MTRAWQWRFWVMTALLTMFGRSDAAVNLVALRALRSGQYRMAIQSTRQALSEDPDDVDAHAIQAIAMARANAFSDAEAAFQLCTGSVVYESEGLMAHADTLRALGHGGEAAELRGQVLLVEEPGQNREMLVDIGQIEDLASVGDFEGAEQAGDRALAVAPRSPFVFATLAELAQREGDEETLGYYLWMASLSDTPTLREVLLRARIALADGDLQGAADLVAQAQGLRRLSLDVRIVQVEVLRREGLLSDALAVLEMPRYHGQEDPDWLGVAIKTRWDAGQQPEALDLLDRAERVYPAHPAIREAAAWVDSNRGQRTP